MDESGARGRLLVAAPTLLDPNFFRTVVMLLEHGEDGALGLVVNRPSDTDLAAVVPGWSDLASAPERVFVGGPVQPEAAICLARARLAPDTAGWAPLSAGDGLGTVDLDGDPALVAASVDELRVFSGYAGWSPGQLEAEVAEGAWYPVDSRPDDAFSREPARLWSAVLRRQGGALAVVSMLPDDPSLN